MSDKNIENVYLVDGFIYFMNLFTCKTYHLYINNFVTFWHIYETVKTVRVLFDSLYEYGKNS